MKISEIAFTGYPAPDLAASRSFYENLLGLVPALVHESPDGSQWVEYEIAGQTLCLGQTPEWKASADGPSIALECHDLDSVLASLESAGTSFLMPKIETPVCHMAIVKDPAGNSLILHKRKPGHP